MRSDEKTAAQNYSSTCGQGEAISPPPTHNEAALGEVIEIINEGNNKRD